MGFLLSLQSVRSVFRKKITTDFRDLTDIDYESKRDYLLNLCNLCSKRKKVVNIKKEKALRQKKIFFSRKAFSFTFGFLGADENFRGSLMHA